LPEGSAAADNPFAGLEDPAAFIAARRAAIAAKVYLISEDFERTKRLPEGVVDQGRPMLLVDGRKRPDLIDPATALTLLISQCNSSFRDIRFGGLIARGFRADDIYTLTKLIDSPEYPDNVIRQNLLKQNRDLSIPDRQKADDTAVRTYLERSRLITVQAFDIWAVEFLTSFSVRARRILLAYAYEAVVPKCHKTLELPLEDHDIVAFRSSAEAP